MKILILGGHLTPALSLIDYLQAEQPATQIVFVGRQFSQIKNHQESQEPSEIQQRAVEFIPFESGRWQFHNPLDIVREPWLLLRGFFQARSILKHHQPTAVVSFGSHLGVPIAAAAASLKIPVILHEQTHVAGLASRITAFFAKKIALSREIINYQFSEHKTALTGNLLRRIFYTTEPVQPEWLQFDQDIPVLYVTGGSQGSRFINELIAESLSDLSARWIVIHQCGKASQAYQPLQDLERASLGIPPLFKSRYFVKEWISDQDLLWILSHARAAISRSGANTVDEFTLFHLPAVYIPLPNAHFGEQRTNAQEAVDQKAGLILSQDQATSESLKVALAELVQNSPRQITSLEDRRTHPSHNAASRLVQLIEQAATP